MFDKRDYETQHLLPEVPNTPAHEQALWDLHMNQESETGRPQSGVPRPSDLSHDAKFVVDLIASHTAAEDIWSVISALKEAAAWLEQWGDGPGRFLLGE